jgi:hypothetical protein
VAHEVKRLPGEDRSALHAAGEPLLGRHAELEDRVQYAAQDPRLENDGEIGKL